MDWQADIGPLHSGLWHQAVLHQMTLRLLSRLLVMAHLCHPPITLLGLEEQGLGPYLPMSNLLLNVLQLPQQLPQILSLISLSGN